MLTANFLNSFDHRPPLSEKERMPSHSVNDSLCNSSWETLSWVILRALLALKSSGVPQDVDSSGTIGHCFSNFLRL